MTAHPDVVPGQHDDGGKQHAGVKKLLTDALHGLGQMIGKQSSNDGPDNAGGDAPRHPPAAPDNAAGGRQYDTDDEGRFQHLAKHDDGRGQHDDSP